jgi:hypothetical protein
MGRSRSISPPLRSSSATSASMIFCEPPRTSGRVGHRLGERRKAVRRAAREQRLGLFGLEVLFGEPERALQRLEPEVRGRDGRAERRLRHRVVHEALEHLEVAHQRAHQLEPRLLVDAEPSRSGLDAALENRGAFSPQRVHQRVGRVHELNAVLLELELREVRRGCGHGVNRRAEIVRKAGQRERQSTCPTAERRLTFDHLHRVARARQGDRRGESVRPTAHHHRIPLLHCHSST